REGELELALPVRRAHRRAGRSASRADGGDGAARAVIRALLFDFDGTVVDTEIATYQAWRDVYAEHGVDLSLEDYLPAVGTGSSVAGAFDAVAHLERLIGSSVDREELVARRAQRKAELYERAPLLAGVRERLAEAQSLG